MSGKKMKVHYAWVVAFCCFLLVFGNVGLASTSFNVYQPYIVALPGIGDSAGAAIIGVRTFVSLICMFVVVRYYQLLDCRRGSAIASLFAAASMVVYGLADSFPLFCVAATFSGIGYGLGGLVCTTYLINRWFKTDVGTAIGIAAVGSGVASMVIPLVAERVISTFGLSVSFWLEAALALGIGVLAYALLRDRPSDLGLEPYVSEKWLAAHQDEVIHEPGHEDVPVDHGVHLPSAWRSAVLFACAIVGAVGVSAATFLSVLLVSEGFAHQFAALMLSVTGLMLTVGKGAMGRIFDLFGPIKGTIIVFLAFIVGLGLLIAGCSGSELLVWAGSIICGFGLAVGTTGLPIWSIHLSLPEERAKTVRSFQTAYAAGSFAFSFVPGVMKDLLGSYVFSYEIMAGLLVVALFVILAAYARFYLPKQG